MSNNNNNNKDMMDGLQDPGSKDAKRIWTSLDVGTEIFVSNKDEEAEWSVSDFDVIIT